MTAILFLGCEMESFTPDDSTVQESGDGYNSSFSRIAIRGTFNSVGALLTPSASATDIWFKAFIWFDARINSNADSTFYIWYDSGGTARIRLLFNPSPDTLTAQYWNGSAWTAAGSAISISPNSVQEIDLHVVCNTASGSLKLYVAGTERINSGVIDLSGATNLKNIYLYAWGNPGGLNNTHCYSQVIVTDGLPTIGWRLMTFYPSGAGSDSAWTGTYADIDESVYSDSDYIYSGTANQVQMVAATAVGSTTGYSIRAVGVGARAKCDATGPQNLQLGLRVSGSNYFSSSKALSVGYAPIKNIWETSPATSVAWTASELSGLQFGVKSIT